MNNNHKTYSVSVSKRETNVNLKELNIWIKQAIKGKWFKKEYKTKIVYTFHDLNDGFCFRLRWTYV